MSSRGFLNLHLKQMYIIIVTCSNCSSVATSCMQSSETSHKTAANLDIPFQFVFLNLLCQLKTVMLTAAKDQFLIFFSAPNPEE